MDMNFYEYVCSLEILNRLKCYESQNVVLRIVHARIIITKLLVTE